MEVYREDLRLENEKRIEQKRIYEKKFAAGRGQRELEYKQHFETEWAKILAGAKGVPLVVDYYDSRKNTEFVKTILKEQKEQKDICIAYYDGSRWDHDFVIHRPNKKVVAISYFSDICMPDIFYPFVYLHEKIYPRNRWVETAHKVYIWPIDATNKEMKTYTDKHK